MTRRVLGLISIVTMISLLSISVSGARAITHKGIAAQSSELDVEFAQEFTETDCPAGATPGTYCLDVTAEGRSKIFGALRFQRIAMFASFLGTSGLPPCPTTVGTLYLKKRGTAEFQSTTS